MKSYTQRIPVDKQWDILKMLIGYRDMQMLMSALEDGYSVTPELIEAMYRLRYHNELVYILEHYVTTTVEKLPIWLFVDSILGQEKGSQIRQRIQTSAKKAKELKQQQLLEKMEAAMMNGELSDDLICWAYNNHRMKELVERFGIEDVWKVGSSGVLWALSISKLPDIFSDEYIVEKMCVDAIISRLNESFYNLEQKQALIKLVVKSLECCRNVLSYFHMNKEAYVLFIEELKANYDDYIALLAHSGHLQKFLDSAASVDFATWLEVYDVCKYDALSFLKRKDKSKALKPSKKQLIRFLLSQKHFRYAWHCLFSI